MMERAIWKARDACKWSPNMAEQDKEGAANRRKRMEEEESKAQ